MNTAAERGTYSDSSGNISLRIIAFVLVLVMVWAGIDLMELASGTGDFLFDYSFKAVLGLSIYWITVILAAPLSIWASLDPIRFEQKLLRPLEDLLIPLGRLRWVLVLVVITLPSFFLLSRLGVSLTFVSVRLLMFAVVSIIGGTLMPATFGDILERVGLSLLATASFFTVSRRLIWVTDYPFKLAWSEGNRLWDYSLYFWRTKYDFLGEFSYPAYLTPGRHGLWGLPFLFPDVSIQVARLWDVLVWTVPYLLLGWAFFAARRIELSRLGRIAGVLWVFLFLSQGGILPPLVLAALVVVITFDQNHALKTSVGAWLASFYAGISRWTWSFAPAAWVALWALLRSDPESSFWKRLRFPILLGLVGLLAAVAAQIFLRMVFPSPSAGLPQSLSQPLLWYRLFPSATNPVGVVPGLAIAIAPIVVFIVWARIRGWIEWDWLQVFGVLTVLVGFLAAGLVASAKIGGGDNLHNLDMFLVALLFVFMEAIYQLAQRNWEPLTEAKRALYVLAAIALLIVSWSAVRSGEPLKLPPDAQVQESLKTIQGMIAEAQTSGEVLFIDQRQLITFGALTDVALHPEYELKDMMNRALSSDHEFFDRFERDLASGRFVLIVVEPQTYEYEGISTEFGDENDLWVRYVTRSLLRYYQPVFADGDLRIALYALKSK